MYRFPTADPPQLVVEVRAGSIAIDTAEVGETTVDVSARHDDAANDVVVEQHGDTIVVVAPRRDRFFGRSAELDVRITAPHRTRLRIKSGSADIAARGGFGTTSITSGSGDVEVGAVDGDLDVTTGSGRIVVRSVTGSANARSGSGQVELGETGTSLRVKTGSGDVSVARSSGELHTISGSGDVRLGIVDGGDIKVRVASGDIHAGVRAGTAAWLDVRSISGRVSSELDEGPAPETTERTAHLRLESVSGDIDLVRV